MADNKEETPPDVHTPELTYIGTGWPPSATGDIESDKGGDKPPPTPLVAAFSVTISTLRDAESSVLTPAHTAVDTYNKLKDESNAKKGWIFQQASGGDLGETSWWNPASQGEQKQKNGPDPQLAAKTKEIVPGLDNALLAVADVIHMTGDFVQYINNTVQVYTKADKDSFLPTQ